MPAMPITLLWYQRIGEEIVFYLDRKASPCMTVDLPCVHAALAHICKRLLLLPSDLFVVLLQNLKKTKKKFYSKYSCLGKYKTMKYKSFKLVKCALKNGY